MYGISRYALLRRGHATENPKKPAENEDVKIPQRTEAAIAMTIRVMAGSSINPARPATSVVMGQHGIAVECGYLRVMEGYAVSIAGWGWLLWRSMWTTLYRNLRVAATTMAICRAYAQPATVRRLPAKVEAGGGVKSLSSLPSRTARLVIFLRAQNKKLFPEGFAY